MADMGDEERSQLIDLADRMIASGAHGGGDHFPGGGKTILGVAGQAHGVLGGLLLIPLVVFGGLGAMMHHLSKNN